MRAYDALGCGAGMVRLAGSLVRLARGDSRLHNRGLVAIDEGEVDLPDEVEPWIDVPSPPPTLAGGGLDSPLRWLPPAIDPSDRDAATYPVYGGLTHTFAGAR